MARKVLFVGHADMPTTRPEYGDLIPEGALGEILAQIVSAPKDKAAVFECDDKLHAIKVADKLRTLLGSGYTFAASGVHVYAKRREE